MIGLLVGWPVVNRACTCAPPIPGQETLAFQTALGYADIVFRGQLVAHRNGMAVFRVREEWKGSLGAEVEVEWRRGDRGDCNGFWPEDLKVGNELLVFAKKGRFGIYRTNICSPTGIVQSAEDARRLLGPGKLKP